MTRARTLAFATILLLCVGCDQAVKRIASDALAGSPGISLAADVVRLELTSNPGAFLSLGEELPESVRRGLFVVGIPVLLALVCGQLLRRGPVSRVQLVGVALLAGGGLGNWLDRLREGAVTDFVSLGIGPFRTGVFNAADVAVLLGIGLVLGAGRARGAPPAEAASDPR